MTMCHCLPSFLDWDAYKKFQKSLMRRHKSNTSFITSLLRALPEHSLAIPFRQKKGNLLHKSGLSILSQQVFSVSFLSIDQHWFRQESQFQDTEILLVTLVRYVFFLNLNSKNSYLHTQLKQNQKKRSGNCKTT